MIQNSPLWINLFIFLFYIIGFSVLWKICLFFGPVIFKLSALPFDVFIVLCALFCFVLGLGFYAYFVLETT